MSQTNANPVGSNSLEAGLSDFNAHSHMINQFLLKTRTATLVKVEAVTNEGGASPVGYVDVRILVQRTDAWGNLNESRVVYNVPYFRLQGGANAVILDPQVGDVGLACVADRDISSVKVSKQSAPAASKRHHDMADALYIGGVLNGAPTQYVQFNAEGITLLSPSKVTIQAPAIAMVGAVSVSETLTAAGDVVGAGVSLSTHLTKGVEPGGGLSGPPQAT